MTENTVALIILIYLGLQFIVGIALTIVMAETGEKELQDYNIFGQIFIVILYLPIFIVMGIFYGIGYLFTWHPKKNTESKESSGRHLKF